MDAGDVVGLALGALIGRYLLPKGKKEKDLEAKIHEALQKTLKKDQTVEEVKA